MIVTGQFVAKFSLSSGLLFSRWKVGTKARGGGGYSWEFFVGMCCPVLQIRYRVNTFLSDMWLTTRSRSARRSFARQSQKSRRNWQPFLGVSRSKSWFSWWSKFYPVSECDNSLRPQVVFSLSPGSVKQDKYARSLCYPWSEGLVVVSSTDSLSKILAETVF